MGVGMPEQIKLNEFGSKVWDYFGSPPYHVGSSLTEKYFRDVDVRMILNDKTYKCMGFGDPGRAHDNAKWVAICLAFAALGREMTGLPIDFQIQQMSWANKIYPRIKGRNYRSALGIVPSRMEAYNVS